MKEHANNEKEAQLSIVNSPLSIEVCPGIWALNSGFQVCLLQKTEKQYKTYMLFYSTLVTCYMKEGGGII